MILYDVTATLLYLILLRLLNQRQGFYVIEYRLYPLCYSPYALVLFIILN